MKTGEMGTTFRLFLVLGRVKTSPPSLRSGQALACFVQGAGQDAVDLHDLRRGLAGVEHGPVHPLQMLRLQLVDAVPADARDDRRRRSHSWPSPEQSKQVPGRSATALTCGCSNPKDTCGRSRIKIGQLVIWGSPVC